MLAGCAFARWVGVLRAAWRLWAVRACAQGWGVWGGGRGIQSEPLARARGEGDEEDFGSPLDFHEGGEDEWLWSPLACARGSLVIDVVRSLARGAHW